MNFTTEVRNNIKSVCVCIYRKIYSKKSVCIVCACVRIHVHTWMCIYMYISERKKPEVQVSQEVPNLAHIT